MSAGAQDASGDASQYLAEAERLATSLPPQLQTEPRAVSRVAVIGAGTMGSRIAIAALDAGLKVLLLEQDVDAYWELILLSAVAR